MSRPINKPKEININSFINANPQKTRDELHTGSDRFLSCLKFSEEEEKEFLQSNYKIVHSVDNNTHNKVKGEQRYGKRDDHNNAIPINDYSPKKAEDNGIWNSIKGFFSVKPQEAKKVPNIKTTTNIKESTKRSEQLDLIIDLLTKLQGLLSPISLDEEYSKELIQKNEKNKKKRSSFSYKIFSIFSFYKNSYCEKKLDLNKYFNITPIKMNLLVTYFDLCSDHFGGNNPKNWTIASCFTESTSDHHGGDALNKTDLINSKLEEIRQLYDENRINLLFQDELEIEAVKLSIKSDMEITPGEENKFYKINQGICGDNANNYQIQDRDDPTNLMVKKYNAKKDDNVNKEGKKYTDLIIELNYLYLILEKLNKCINKITLDTTYLMKIWEAHHNEKNKLSNSFLRFFKRKEIDPKLTKLEFKNYYIIHGEPQEALKNLRLIEAYIQTFINDFLAETQGEDLSKSEQKQFNAKLHQLQITKNLVNTNIIKKDLGSYLDKKQWDKFHSASFMHLETVEI